MSLKGNPKILAASLEDSYFGRCCITSMKMRLCNTAAAFVDPPEAGLILEHQAHWPPLPAGRPQPWREASLKDGTVLLNFGIPVHEGEAFRREALDHNEAVADAEGDGFSPAGRAQLTHDGGDVKLNGMLGNFET